MKDGVYRVTLKIDGETVLAEGQVSNGVFQGLGALSGIVGVLCVDLPLAANDSGAEETPDHGECHGMQWERVDLPHPPATLPDLQRIASQRATIAALRDHAGHAIKRGVDARNASRSLRSQIATSANHLQTALAALDHSIRLARKRATARKPDRYFATT